MYNSDALGESAAITGLKCFVVMFIALALFAFPILQSSIGGQFAVFDARMRNVALNSTQITAQPTTTNSNDLSRRGGDKMVPDGLNGLAN